MRSTSGSIAPPSNRLLTEVYDRVNRRIQNLRFRSNFDHEKWNRAARDHALMVEALEARDGARLAAMLRAHLIQKGETVLEAMRRAAGEARRLTERRRDSRPMAS